HEIMYLNDKIRDAMVKGLSAEELREVARQNGMVSLWNVGKTYVMQGITSIQELMGLYME
ncbi:MAG: hypothetical protein WCY04_05955, partial [Bacilli bacterium]